MISARLLLPMWCCGDMSAFFCEFAGTDDCCPETLIHLGIINVILNTFLNIINGYTLHIVCQVKLQINFLLEK